MPLANILSGATFRLALKLLAAFIGMLILVGYLLVSALSVTLENQTQAQLEEEAVLFNDIFQAEGQQGLIDSVRSLSKRNKVFNHELGLFDENKLHLGGSISLIPNFIGWQKTSLVLLKKHQQTNDAEDKTASTKSILKGEQQYHAKVFKVDKLTLVVGRSTANIETLVTQLIYWLVAIGVSLSLGIVFLGYIASARSYAKLKGMSNTLRAIAQGNVASRIEISADNDQIDVIARQMNAHLAHLEKLIGGIQSTATAVAHDLKTPLSHAQIALYEAQELIEQNLNPQTPINSAQNKLDQLNKTFDTILRISRIQVHTDKSQFKAHDICHLIENVMELLEPVAQQRAITLQADAQQLAHPEILECDKGMIQQLLINLINNALVHCPQNSLVKLQVQRQQAQLLVIVEDNGPGIPDSEKAEILKPFTRLSQSRTTQGNGLGLALVKAIVDQHGASIDLQNAQPGLRVVISFDMQPNVESADKKVS